MTNKEIVLDFIKKSESHTYCDDCLSEILDIKPRQQINMICRQLNKEKNIERTKNSCFNCRKDKLVNK